MNNGTVPSFITPCGPDGMLGPQPLVKPGQVIDVTFPGTPPYNLTRSMSTGGQGYCRYPVTFSSDANSTYVLETNTYRWVVENATRQWSRTFNGPGDGIMFVAVELTPIPGRTENNSTSHYYHYSANYTIYDPAFPSGRRPVSEASAVVSLKASMVFGLLALPALLGTLL